MLLIILVILRFCDSIFHVTTGVFFLHAAVRSRALSPALSQQHEEFAFSVGT